MALLKCLVGMALITSALMCSAVNRSCRFSLVYCLIYLLYLPDLPLIILVEYLYFCLVLFGKYIRIANQLSRFQEKQLILIY